MEERRPGCARFPDSLMPRYTEVVIRVGCAEDPVSTLVGVIEFRKLDLYASLCIGRGAGRKSYVARFAVRTRGEDVRRTVCAIDIFQPL